VIIVPIKEGENIERALKSSNGSMKNTGTGDAKDVKATFSTTSSYVSYFDPTYARSYNNIAAGKVRWVWTDLADSRFYEFNKLKRRKVLSIQ